jgi:hypothetical protein
MSAECFPLRFIFGFSGKTQAHGSVIFAQQLLGASSLWLFFFFNICLIKTVTAHV